MPDAAAYLRAIVDESTVLVDAAVVAGLDARVPSCPEWDVAALLGHIGGVQRWAADMSQRAPDAERVPRDERAVPGTGELVDWFRAGTGILVDALDRPADEPAWSWIPPATVGFWQRRQAHEAAMHRVDAQLAARSSARSSAGAPTPIPVELATDGIDEFLSMIQAFGPPGLAGSGETLHFHCTDIAGEWLVYLGPDGVALEREHAKGDVAVRGAASALLCWLQGRGSLEPLEVFGDGALLDRWRTNTAW